MEKRGALIIAESLFFVATLILVDKGTWQRLQRKRMDKSGGQNENADEWGLPRTGSGRWWIAVTD